MQEDVEINFEQRDLINSVFQQVDEINQVERTEVIRKSRASTMKSGDFLLKEKVCTLLEPTKKEDFLGNSLNKVFVGNIVIKQITMSANLRIRGIERVLKKRGALGFLMNFGSNFGDITGAEFVF